MDSVHDDVKEYYGKTIQTATDLLTDTCQLGASTAKDKLSVRQAISSVHDDILATYYGCGLTIPSLIEDARVVDLGSGTGRDCYAISKLVGPKGFVVGVDMTDEQLELARKYVTHHQEKFGYPAPNVEFRKGYIENLKDAHVEDNQYDIVVSNCVINLSPDKPSVVREAHRVLKEGGEFYFSDIYVQQDIPEHIRKHKVLWGECLAGALCWTDLEKYAEEIGFTKPRVVTARKVKVEDKKLLEVTGDIVFMSVTYRLFKLSKDDCKNPAVVTYNGTLAEYETELPFDIENTFKANVPVKVDAELAEIMRKSRYSKVFTIGDGAKSGETEIAKDCPVDPYVYLGCADAAPGCC
ncbi:arsenite methyltransferase [Strongylocentrotus purpuratus]|uniref:Arsenite methyltransferase n=1 Tax=Strongylocentrotus purpuratus TaxID=7668 RepID=A0A7M7TGJ7_STRPU|nr:arsenite methyltransferase [Strongylocentrotus purpuratus]|eukprot:XP_784275.2 PREDICTED: arsenite methyltransferase [Strongylocentrotus purpuratus]